MLSPDHQHVLDILLIPLPPETRVPLETVKFVAFQCLDYGNHVCRLGASDRVQKLGMSSVIKTTSRPRRPPFALHSFTANSEPCN